MKTLGIIIIFISFLLAQYFQIKASKFLKDEFRNKFFNKFSSFPNSFNDEAYTKKEGPGFRNLGLVIGIAGTVIGILLISLSG